MPIAQLQMTFDDMNISAQVGDIIYYSINTVNTGGFGKSTLPNTRKLGPIISIDGGSIQVQYDDAVTGAPPVNSFISFVKDKKVNSTSMLGYYAKVKFVNNSTDKAELFSVGSEITESSK
jgi:hypothetical protein